MYLCIPTFSQLSGLYYDYKTGYYYDADKSLYYDGNTGTYLKYDQETKQYEVQHFYSLDNGHIYLHIVTNRPVLICVLNLCKCNIKMNSSNASFLNMSLSNLMFFTQIALILS